MVMLKIWLTVGIIFATMIIFLLRRRADGSTQKDEDGFYRLRDIAFIGPGWFLLYICLLVIWLNGMHESTVVTIAFGLLVSWSFIGAWFVKPPKVAIDRQFVEYDEDFTVKIQFSTLPRRPFTVKIGSLKYRIDYPERLNVVRTRIPFASGRGCFLCIRVFDWYFRVPLIDKRTGKKAVKLRVAGISAAAPSHES